MLFSYKIPGLNSAVDRAKEIARADNRREAARLRRINRHAVKRTEIKKELIYRIYVFVALLLIFLIMFFAKN